MKTGMYALIICIALLCTVASNTEDQTTYSANTFDGGYWPMGGDPANIGGQWIPRPGNYQIPSGTLIAMEFTFVGAPGAIPDNIEIKTSHKGHVVKSSLGKRWRLPVLTGASTWVFCLKAKKPGIETVYLIVDEITYEYVITITP